MSDTLWLILICIQIIALIVTVCCVISIRHSRRKIDQIRKHLQKDDWDIY